MISEGFEKLIPTQAYLFFPKDDEVKNASGVRLLFDGNLKFDDYENKVIKEFRAYARKCEIILQQAWTDNILLRFLQANAFKMDKTLNAVKEHSAWKLTKLPTKLTPQIQELLDKGYFYIHGRDHKFRPIIVFNVHMIEMKKLDVELMIDALTYLLEFVLREMLLPGQVENWVLLLDLQNMGLATLPLNPLKRLLGFIQHTYRGRLYVMYIVNTPSTIYIPFQMAKKFLEDSTVNKIQFHKKQIPEPLFQHANKEQVEEKFGGTAPNVEKFWPPICPSKNFFLNENEANDLISRETYIYLYENGRLIKYKVNMELACPPLDSINSEYPNRDSTAATNPVFVFSTHRTDLARPSLNDMEKQNAAKKKGLPQIIFIDSQKTKSEEKASQNKGTRLTTGLETEGAADFKDMMNEKAQHLGWQPAIPQLGYSFLTSPKFGPKTGSPTNRTNR